MITLRKRNEVFLEVEGPPGVLMEIREHFTFEVPGAKHMPQYKNKMWDGKIRLFNPMTRLLYLGLAKHLIQFCEQNQYPVVNEIPPLQCPEYEAQRLHEFVASLPLRAAREVITVKDYQMVGVDHAIAQGRSMLISPTASGKSLMLYLMMRWHHHFDRKQLLIVPTQSLVEQMYTDFQQYSASDPSFSVEESCQRIYEGHTKTVTRDVVITTWQSIYKNPPSFFEQFEVLYGDEAHGFKAKSLSVMMEKTTTIPFKVGTTGTLDGTKTNELVLEGLFGPQFQVTTTKTLMQTQQVSNLKIRCIVLKHPPEVSKVILNSPYEDEAKYIASSEVRNRFIRNLAVSLKGNTLILFQRVEDQGKPLYAMIQEIAKGRPVFFVHGKVSVTHREEVRRKVEELPNAIIVASYGVFSTGVNIKRLHNLIFASPTKSKIRNLQSIGRGLRKANDKTEVVLYDLADDFSRGKRQNTTLKHFLERLSLYETEELDYTIHKVSL